MSQCVPIHHVSNGRCLNETTKVDHRTLLHTGSESTKLQQKQAHSQHFQHSQHSSKVKHQGARFPPQSQWPRSNPNKVIIETLRGAELISQIRVCTFLCIAYHVAKVHIIVVLKWKTAIILKQSRSRHHFKRINTANLSTNMGQS